MAEQTAEFSISDLFDPSQIFWNLLVLIFVAGGYYYVTPQQIESNSDSIESHVSRASKEFDVIKSKVSDNSNRIGQIEQDYISQDALDGFARKEDLKSLERLMREIQQSQAQRLDYIIKRLDSDR